MPPGTSWDPALYLKYSDHRLRPALELIQRVPLAAPAVVYDLGCGTGHVTRLLAERWPAASVTGVDHSPQMLAEARADGGSIRWLEADLRTWRPHAAPDLLFSNATLHWIEDHGALFPRLASWLSPGGCLAVQMPRSWGLDSHRLMRETLADGGIGSPALRKSLERDPVEEPRFYYDLLAPRASAIEVWETEYVQALEGSEPVLEWVRATGLRPVLEGLAGAERERFLDEYARRLRAAYPRRPDGRTLYPFRRLFVVATF